MKRYLLICLIFISIQCPTIQAQSEASTGELFEITLLRAAPGFLPELIQSINNESRDELVMRHSQGDHWDLMIVRPTKADELLTANDYSDLVDFDHRFIATSASSWAEIWSLKSESEIFHIEMFNAARGHSDELWKEREMENVYLVETGRAPNLIFRTLLGSDFDCFTIGFYKSMVQFSTDPDLSDETYHKAATKAGFISRSDIGFELRQHIVGHKDTIATKVR